MFFSGHAAIAFPPFPTVTPDQMLSQSGTILHAKLLPGKLTRVRKPQPNVINLTIPGEEVGCALGVAGLLEEGLAEGEVFYVLEDFAVYVGDVA